MVIVIYNLTPNIQGGLLKLLDCTPVTSEIPTVFLLGGDYDIKCWGN